MSLPRAMPARLRTLALATALIAGPVAAAPVPIPADAASGVSRVAAVGLRFATPARAAAQTVGSLQLRSPIGLPVDAALQITGDQALLQPRLPLAGCTTYTLAQGRPPHTISHFTTTCSTWSAPTQIDDSRTARLVDRPVNGPQVAVTGDGGFVAVWFQDDDGRRAILASRFNPDTQSWSAPQAIDLHGPGASGSSTPALATGPQGQVTAVWFQAVDGRDAILAARLGTTGWSPPQRLDDPALPGNATNPQLAVDALGNVTVVWQQPDGHHTGIEAARWDAAADRWQPARNLDRGTANAYNPVVATTPQGRVVVAWQQGASGSEAVDATTRAAPQVPWSPPQRLSPAGQPATMPALAATPQGAVLAAWSQGRQAQRRIVVRRLAPARSQAPSWSATHTLQSSAFQGAALSPTLIRDAAGNVTLTWQQTGLTQGAARDAILASRLRADRSGWTTPTQIDDPAQRSAGNPVLAVDAAGGVRCAWYQDGPEGMQVQIARLNPETGAWNAPQTLSDPQATVQASFPAIAISPAGSVMVVWQQFNGWRTVAVARWLP